MKTVRNKDTKAILVSGVLILLVGGIFLFRQFWDGTGNNQATPETTPESTEEPEAVPAITAEVVRQKITNGEKIRFLDTRDKESFRLGHIPHSTLLSPGALGVFVPENDELLVVVYSVQDTAALEIIQNSLRQKPYSIFLLEGGFEGWKRGGNQVISFGDPNSFIDQSKITYISLAETTAALNDPNQSIFVLDVQSEQNYQKKHLKGAKNIPLDQLEKRFREIPPSKNIIVYGESELASFQAGVRLSDLNIFTAKTLSGNTHLEPNSGLTLEP